MINKSLFYYYPRLDNNNLRSLPVEIWKLEFIEKAVLELQSAYIIICRDRKLEYIGISGYEDWGETP